MTILKRTGVSALNKCPRIATHCLTADATAGMMRRKEPEMTKSQTTLLRPIALGLVLLAVSCTANRTASAEEWGDLTGTITIDAKVKVPAQANINVDKDREVCGKHNLKVESVIVNPENRGFADILVYVYARKGPKPPVHADYKETADAKVTLDNVGCRYEPRVTLLRTTQTLVIGNKDTIGHNTKIDTFKNPPINPIIPAGAEIEQKFPVAETRPSPVGCNIHPWMAATLLVQDHPYMTVTDKDGKFTIEKLPAGEWTFQFRHPMKGYITDVTVNNKTEEWKKGRTKLKIKSGTNDLGNIVISAANAEKLFK